MIGMASTALLVHNFGKDGDAKLLLNFVRVGRYGASVFFFIFSSLAVTTLHFVQSIYWSCFIGKLSHC